MKKLLMLLIIYFLMIPNVLALNKYKVTFVMDESFKNTIEVEENTTVTAPEPVKEGYTLVGFTNNGVLFDFNTPITSDITLVAIWQSQEVKVDEVEEPINITDTKEETITRDRGYSDLSDEIKYLIIGIPVVIVIAIKYFLVPAIKKNKENKN